MTMKMDRNLLYGQRDQNHCQFVADIIPTNLETIPFKFEDQATITRSCNLCDEYAKYMKMKSNSEMNNLPTFLSNDPLLCPETNMRSHCYIKVLVIWVKLKRMLLC